MSARRKPAYDDRSITSLKGPDRVRKRPAVMFGSDGLEGCEHAFLKYSQMQLMKRARAMGIK